MNPITVRKLKVGEHLTLWDGKDVELRRPWVGRVALFDGKPVGWMRYRRYRDFDVLDDQVCEAKSGPFVAEGAYGDPVAWLDSLWVTPAARGRGVLRALVQELHDLDLPLYGAFREWWLETWMEVEFAEPRQRAVWTQQEASDFRRQVLTICTEHASALEETVELIWRAPEEPSAVTAARERLSVLAEEIGGVVPSDASRFADRSAPTIAFDLPESGFLTSLHQAPLGALYAEPSEGHPLEQSRHNASCTLVSMLLGPRWLRVRRDPPRLAVDPLGQFWMAVDALQSESEVPDVLGVSPSALC